jgi:hypothetical protein
MKEVQSHRWSHYKKNKTRQRTKWLNNLFIEKETSFSLHVWLCPNDKYVNTQNVNVNSNVEYDRHILDRPWGVLDTLTDRVVLSDSKGHQTLLWYFHSYRYMKLCVLWHTGDGIRWCNGRRHWKKRRTTHDMTWHDIRSDKKKERKYFLTVEKRSKNGLCEHKTTLATFRRHTQHSACYVVVVITHTDNTQTIGGGIRR